ncbi:MAG: hypothetical protein RLZZ241_122, partial [Bacteroidota bacterium]
MPTDIRIKKGLNINLVGAAEPTISQTVPSNFYALNLADFHGFTPKLLVREGGRVHCGDPLFCSKDNESLIVAAPASGEVVEIERGARRRILSMRIKADKEQLFREHSPLNLAQATGQEVRDYLLKTGCWPFIKQRPYDIIADPNVAPKAIFISAYVTAPLAADINLT